MSKKEIKAILAHYGYKLIKPSWYRGKEEEQSVLFTAYDQSGTCHRFFVDWRGTESKREPFARMQTLSDVCLHDMRDVTYMFFKEVEA